MGELAVANFESRVARAVDRVRVVLDAEKNPCFPSQLHHQYEDKYQLAEVLTSSASASQLNCLALLGLTVEQLGQLREWAQRSYVSLRFRTEERCTYLREETRDVEDPTKHVTEVSVGGMARASFTSKVVTKVTEHFWKFEVSYELLAVRGVGAQPEDLLQILTRQGRDELKTSGKASPRPERTTQNFEVDTTWLLKQLPAGAVIPTFRVDRTSPACKTPRRNPEVEDASVHFSKFRNWAQSTLSYLETLLGVQPDPTHKLDMQAVRQLPPVISVTPLMLQEGRQQGDAAQTGATSQASILAQISQGGGLLLSQDDANKLLVEEARALQEVMQQVRQAYPSGGSIASAAEGVMVVLLRQCAEVCNGWSAALDYIESLLRKQLIAAIGKEVTPADFAEYMRFHNRKLFADAYLPLPFCFAVRRSQDHAPEGAVSLEQTGVGEGGNSMAMPIVTVVAQAAHPHPMEFPLNASTNIGFTGERYLHAWLNHKFSGDAGAPLQLVARTRQFSSMLVLVGRIASATVFEPKYAAILQNKDELTIPLELSTIPTPKEFKDAIESLSPEMRAFAKAFRAMQLESTLFGVLIIHIKPQLEKVLNLAPDSLTKEIKLTQDLMQLFIKYQIPSDLLSFDDRSGAGGARVDAAPAERLNKVKAHVAAMQEMIEASKKEELEERRMEANYANPLTPQSPPELQSLIMQRDIVMEQSLCLEQLEDRMECMAESAAPKGRKKGGGIVGSIMSTMKGIRGGPQASVSMSMPEAMPRCATIPTIGAPAAAAAPPAAQQQQQQQQQQEARGTSAAASSSQAPQQSQPSPEPQQPQQPQQQPQPEESSAAAAGAGPVIDYTEVPTLLDRRFEALDSDGSLRPTIINVKDTWEKRAQKALLAQPETNQLGTDEQKREKEAAFDLLDGLTKSGALPVEHAALHVIIAATHCFDKTVTDTVIKDNVNPIDKVERSTLIMATTVHQRPANALLQPSQCARVQDTSPMLFLEEL